MARNPLATVLLFDVVDEAAPALAPALAAAVTLPFLSRRSGSACWRSRSASSGSTATRSTPDAEGIVVAPRRRNCLGRPQGGRTAPRWRVHERHRRARESRAAAGEVREVRHRPGANRPAFDKESDRNEQVAIDSASTNCWSSPAGSLAGSIPRSSPAMPSTAASACPSRSARGQT